MKITEVIIAISFLGFVVSADAATELRKVHVKHANLNRTTLTFEVTSHKRENELFCKFYGPGGYLNGYLYDKKARFVERKLISNVYIVRDVRRNPTRIECYRYVK